MTAEDDRRECKKSLRFQDARRCLVVAVTSGTLSRRGGFTLVELLASVSVMLVLLSMLMPVVRNVREGAARVHCMSNLRQIGQIELSYSMENRGWILLRENGHPGMPGRLCNLAKGYFSRPLHARTGADIWFCPQAHERISSDIISATRREELMSAAHQTGYAFYGGWWDGNRARGVAHPLTPPFSLRTNPNAVRINQVHSNFVRAGEWFEPTVAMGGTGGTGAGLPNHYDSRGNCAGGNLLMGDGSVHWSANAVKYLMGDLYVYVMPDDLHP